LVAGNTVVLKSPETSPLSASVLGELCRDVLPPGVVNLVSGFGLPVGDRIARHPDVRRIGFTGSIATGLAIQKAAAEVCVKHVSLELGGKNSLIICEDADLEVAIDAAVAGMNFAWAGQSCGSTSRILVHRSHYERAIELLRSRLGKIRVGDALDPESEMGPLNSKTHYQRVMSLIDQGVRVDSARVIIGAERPVGKTFDKGFWISPTLLADVTPDMVVGREEIFGPVMCVSSFAADHEALALANATRYGLTASVFGRDLGRVLSMAQKLQAGVVAVNGTRMHHVGLPFGGTKDSGLGGEECLDELLSYTQQKAIHVSL
jgi:acyl-CoA reductase-like NAD-dependent aldehyde dehydrogenase